MKPGDVVVEVLVGAQETKVRPAVVIASPTYLAERPDAVVGILTTKLPRTLGTTDYVLMDWRSEAAFGQKWSNDVSNHNLLCGRGGCLGRIDLGLEGRPLGHQSRVGRILLGTGL